MSDTGAADAFKRTSLKFVRECEAIQPPTMCGCQSLCHDLQAGENLKQITGGLVQEMLAYPVSVTPPLLFRALISGLSVPGIQACAQLLSVLLNGQNQMHT